MSKIHYTFEERDVIDLPISWNEPDTRKELLAFLQENWDQRDALFDDANKSSYQQFLTQGKQGILLRANNYIGTICFKGETLNIFPKVFLSSNEEPNINDLIRNLVQWLDYCNRFDPRYISIKSEINGDVNLKELFVTLFAKKLESVVNRGIYLTYEQKEDDLPFIRGRLDVPDYLVRKISNGKAYRFLCEYSSFEFDNTLNRIIKCVCMDILREGTRPINEKRIRNILNKMVDVTDIRCTYNDCMKVRLNRTQKGYSDILAICKMFLLNKEPSYTINYDDAFCFLFPTELLFEGFIGGFLKEIMMSKSGTIELQAKTHSLVNDIVYAGKSYGSAFNLRPDIICTLGNKVFLMDTKYKRLQRFEQSKDDDDVWKSGLIKGIQQDDLYQVSIYAVKHNLSKAYLIYPLDRFEELEPDIPALQEVILTGNGLDELKQIEVYLLRVPFVFEEDIERTKSLLATSLLNAFEL